MTAPSILGYRYVIFILAYFLGLSVAESGKLSSYMHFRETRAHEPKTIEEKADLEPSIDFMDTIENDIPRGW